MTLCELIDATKAELAACRDVDDADRILRDLRDAEPKLMQATLIAFAVAEKLVRRDYPVAWQPFTVIGGRKA